MARDFDRTARLGYLQIEPADQALLREFREVLARHIDRILDGFYAHVERERATGAVLADRAVRDRARAGQRRHWVDNVFAGTFDDGYMESVTRIGHSHERVGLEPRWYIGGYCFTLNAMVDIAVEHYRKDSRKLAAVVKAINKAVCLDMDLAISVYIQAGKDSTAKILNTHADAFERNVMGVVQQVSASAGHMQATAAGMSRSARTASERATTVAAAAEQASSNVQTVAAAAEELSASIGEIGRQVTQSTRISQSAVEEVQRTDAMVRGLSEAAGRIGAIVKLINDIASQTNLLALNATIEAARAGEAGKGFAVVANEVKSLARQTAKATEDIAAQIGSVQSATRDSVDAIKGIAVTINEINQIASAIAAAVEEQGAATQEIARNVQEAAAGTRQVSSTIAEVDAAASETGRAAGEVQGAAGELGRHAERLTQEVGRFVAQIRGG